MKFHVPLRLYSLPNQRWYWTKTATLAAQQRAVTTACMHNATVDEDIPVPPLTVTITRIGPRRLDDDNLAAACKYVRDAIAARVGVDDGSDLYTWIYKQVIGKTYGVEVDITTR